MINYVKGILTQKSPVSATIETMGMGWELRIPVSTFETLPKLGSECQLYASLYISQDDIRLYGFTTQSERELFSILTKISGIGPKIAISILSTLSINAFVKSIRSGEEGLLTRVPGIGKKSAQRLIVELRDRIHKLIDFVESGVDNTEGVVGEVENALIALGFNTSLIQKELKLLSPEEVSTMSAEQLIKETIKRLYQRNK